MQVSLGLANVSKALFRQTFLLELLLMGRGPMQAH